MGEKKVNAIEVIDNGDGLNTANYASFTKYRTKHKLELGCKGIGRFILLKVYESVTYQSALQAEQEVVGFKFEIDFDTDSRTVMSAEVGENRTSASMLTLTEAYYNPEKKIDRRLNLNLEDIRNNVLHNLIPTLFFYKRNGVIITVTFHEKGTENVISITSDTDVPAFVEKSFAVTRNGETNAFKLYHAIKTEPGGFDAYHCAHNRTVCSFSDVDLKLALPYGYSATMLLESSYLDERVNNERNQFSIFPVRTDAFNTLSWENINEELKKSITELVKEGIPDTERLNKAKLKEIEEERPYLLQYIDAKDLDIAGFIDKKQIIERAKKNFDHSKERVLTGAGKKDYTDSELREAIELAQNELVSYVNDRVMILDRLNSLVKKKEKVEKIIHNLIMEMGTEDDYFMVGKNNLWLLDDRFTTYSYAASDKRIREVLKAVDVEPEEVRGLNDEPDLSIFFSKDPSTKKQLKAVVVEIKPFDYDSKPSRKKFAGIQQLIDDIKAFKAHESIEEVFAFLITHVDDELAERLDTDGYKPLFSMGARAFHRLYEKPSISVYVLSAETLIADAEARNRVFLDIIRKQKRISGMLK